MDKKKLKLGMNPSTARSRLIKDLLFNFVAQAGILCYRCNKELTKETFSIEHKEPWLNSDNPKEKYFDLNNISYSHQSCNSQASVDDRKKYYTSEEKKTAKSERFKKWWGSLGKEEQQRRRRELYETHGC